jgi:hypothetical protein
MMCCPYFILCPASLHLEEMSQELLYWIGNVHGGAIMVRIFLNLTFLDGEA